MSELASFRAFLIPIFASSASTLACFAGGYQIVMQVYSQPRRSLRIEATQLYFRQGGPFGGIGLRALVAINGWQSKPQSPALAVAL